MEYTQWFFTAYYWFINVGALIAFLGIATLQQINFFHGYIASCAALVLSLVTFLAGRCECVHAPLHTPSDTDLHGHKCMCACMY